MAKKLFIETHGCQMNEYDSSRMADLLGEHQALEVTENAAEADVILLNTCSIREKAQEKVFSKLGMWRELKQQNPDLVIGVGGCVASQEGAASLSEIDNLEDYLEDIERKLIMQALEETRWNRTAAAQRLGLTFRSMRYRLKKLGID